MNAWKNQLYFGDNLEILRSGRIPVASVDLIYLDPPTRPMWEEAAAAGFYVSEFFPEKRFPGLQILTIAELFAGKRLEYRPWVPSRTFKKAARRRKGPKDEAKQGQLDM